MAIPLVLAGPVLRRAEPGRVCIWLATSAPLQVGAEVFGVDHEGGEPVRLGAGDARTAQLGANLFVHLAVVTPDDEPFPTDALLAYDLSLSAPGQPSRRLADLGLLDGPDRIAYDDLPLPTFFLRGELPVLHLLHGSCRLLHGKGEDAMIAADATIAHHVRDLEQRPSTLLLTGDQIYGDDVAGPLVAHVRGLADRLCGPADATSVPGTPPLGSVPVYRRTQLTCERARFTSSKPDNHLFSFGEYAAMYLTAWNEATWPATFPAAGDAVPSGRAGLVATAKARRRYTTELDTLEMARRALPAVRRTLANIPTYMVFDDHDVTDDWNLTGGWRQRVHASPTGRRVIANALAAFWGFQGWGNDPDLFDDAFTSAVTQHLSGDGDGDAYDRALWAFDRWSFCVPTDPPTIALDTRTQRAFDNAEGAARLIGVHERTRVGELARQAGHRAGEPLIFISAVPMYGLELQERRQKYLVDKVGPYEIDFEEWHSNLGGFVDWMRLLIDELEVPSCLMLSGDVHYGINVEAMFILGDRRLPIVQLVSSSFKHSGAASRLGLDAIGSVVHRVHRRMGWDGPPHVEGARGWKQRVLRRAANTDAWDADSPVFLAPSTVRHLGIRQRPDYRESRRYVPPAERRTSVLVGENNVGLVSLREEHVTHRLLTRVNETTRVYTAEPTMGGTPPIHTTR